MSASVRGSALRLLCGASAVLVAWATLSVAPSWADESEPPAGRADEPAPAPLPAPPAEVPAVEPPAPPAPPASTEAAAPTPPGTDLPPAPPPAPPQSVVGGLGCCEMPSACRPKPCGGCYASLSFDVFSGLGGTATLGMPISRSPSLEKAFELAYTYMDQWEEFDGEGQDGKLTALRAGLAWRTDPCCRRHWVFRAGFAWFRTSGQPRDIKFDFVDLPVGGTFWGGYVGVGYEWDHCGGRWSHGPEIQAMGGWEPDDGEWGFTPTVRWRLTYRF